MLTDFEPMDIKLFKIDVHIDEFDSFLKGATSAANVAGARFLANTQLELGTIFDTNCEKHHIHIIVELPPGE